ncbi:MAG: glycosyltransferase family 2 protein [Thermoplasmata archaeon]|nr:MAG: glycosyltransferase family 2 protein [Thermoplasmata archaeon]
MWRNQKVTVIFPAYNEEENIRHAVNDFLRQEYVDEVIVVDNNSKDNTVAEVKKTKAKLVREKKQGYGNAIQGGLKVVDSDLIIIAEPDGTFEGKDVLKLLVYSDDFDMVLGTRTSKELIREGANMGPFLKWGNWFLGKMIEVLFNGPNLTDVGCTMRLIRKDSLKKIQSKFTVGGSHFSPEMMILSIVCKLRVIEISLNYNQRVGTSKITGETMPAFKLGLVMMYFILRSWVKYEVLQRDS